MSFARGLQALFAAMGGDASWQRAELALTLHMIAHVAPRTFAEHQLRVSLPVVPTHFDGTLSDEEAMARLDMLYLRVVRGEAVEAPKGLAEAVMRAEDPLWRWLMGQLAARLGVQTASGLDPRWPFSANARLHRYHLTHEILIATEYLRLPVPEHLGPVLEELEGALPELEGQWDLLGECVMCLARAGRPAPAAVKALKEAQLPDGSWAEAKSTAREAAHCTAAVLVALAGALDLKRSDP